MPGLTDTQTNTLLAVLELQTSISDMQAKIHAQAVAIATRDKIIELQKEEIAVANAGIKFLTATNSDGQPE